MTTPVALLQRVNHMQAAHTEPEAFKASRPLICSDRSRGAGRLFRSRTRVSRSRGRYRRRLIKLIFAGRNRIIMIRRDLPQTSDASPAEPVANVRRGFSFVFAPAAADLAPRVRLPCSTFCFFLSGKVFVFSFRHTASCGVQACSALIEMAQIKPSSSRAIAVMIFL